MQTLWQDVRYGLRMLVKSPGFAVVAVLTLALGIGANTAIFSVVNAVLLKSLPYPDPDRLIAMHQTNSRQEMESVSWMDFLDWRAQNHSFGAMAVYRTNSFALTGFGRPAEIAAGEVSAAFFPLVGAKTILGRTFTDAEDTPTAAATALVSYGFWRGQMGGDPGALGKTLVLDQNPYTIIGVLTPEFKYFQERTDVYVPVGRYGASPNFLFRANHPGLMALGRLRPGISLSAAQADLTTIQKRIDAQYPATNSGQGVALKPIYDFTFGRAQPALFILLAAVACVLLIACANVANLLLARAASRQKEFSIRVAIGAGKMRVFRQLLTESVLLSVVGGALGFLLANWSIGPLLSIAPKDIPRLGETHMDARAFLFTLGVAVATGILFGMAPAFQASRADINAELKEGSRSSTTGRARHRLRSGVLVAEVALAFVLVVASGLLIRSLSKALEVSPGFRTDHLLTLDVALPLDAYKTDPQQIAFQTQALERIRNLPGVESASAVFCLPLNDDCWDSIFYLDDRPVPTVSELPRSVFNIVDTEYFKTMEVPLLAGRFFTPSDKNRANPVVMINETFAKRFWPHSNPIGSRIKQSFPGGKSPFMEIVGVVGDLNEFGLDQQEWPEVFEPEALNSMPSMTFVVRTKVEPIAVSGSVVDTIQAVDKDLPVTNIQPLTQYLDESLARRKFSTLLLGLFGGLAILLAAVGIYGVMAYTVAQRTHEFGIRMALGAQREDVLSLVVKYGVGLALAGIVIGLGFSFLLTRWMQSELFGVSNWDPLTFSVVAGLLCGVAILACYVPTRRAMRVDPMVALRYE